MSSLRIRPRFKHLILANQEELEKQLCAALEQKELFTFSHLPGHLYIRIRSPHQHFWSPQLHLSFEQAAENVEVRGLYGPNPTLWTIFFLTYGALGMLSLFAAAWGFSLWSLGKDASILWAVPLLVGLALLLYLASQVGQKLGAQQMFDIHHFYEDITQDKIVVH